MLQMQARYDPLKMYEPALFSKLASNKDMKQDNTEYVLTDGCVMDRTCYCVIDEHCAKGFKCVGSNAFPEYKVCKPPAFV